MKKTFISGFFFFLGCVAMAAQPQSVIEPAPAAAVQPDVQSVSDPSGRSIVILYENDVHCGIDGYVKLAGLRDAIAASDTAYVALVSSGDFVQGGTAGTLSKGQYIIDVVNSVHYDAMTIGNHEFDYGTPRLLELTSQLNAPVTCVNFSNLADGRQFYAPYVLRRLGDRQVAFVGVLTPSTLYSEASAFYDEAGQLLYDLHSHDVPRMVQQSVDAARAQGADYVIVLSHLGESGPSITSSQLIAQTHGIDALLDGHSHSVIPCNMLPCDSVGQSRLVLASQTGTKFQHVGKLVISPAGHLSSELLTTDSIRESSQRVAAVVDSIKLINAALTNRVCGINDQLLTINGADGKRRVRQAETNLSNFIPDAFRWFGGSELAMVNGGGIRSDLPQGEVTYGKILEVQPFDTQLCVARLSGSMLASVLEVAASQLPSENGMFVHPSGFRYQINVADAIRVSDIEVQQADGSYQPLDLDRYYTVTLGVYLLGQYQGLLHNAEILKVNIGVDAEAVYEYIVNALGGHIGSEYAQPQGRVVIH